MSERLPAVLSSSEGWVRGQHSTGQGDAEADRDGFPSARLYLPNGQTVIVPEDPRDFADADGIVWRVEKTPVVFR